MSTSTQVAFAFSKATVGAVLSAFAKAQKVEQSVLSLRNAAGQKLVDELVLRCDTPNRESFFKKSKARQACIEVFTAAGLSGSAVDNYPTAVKLAFIHDVPFAASLFTKAGKIAAGIETAEPADKADEKAGTVKTTNPAETAKTARKLIAQLRLLGRDDTAAGIVDVIRESFPDFSEVDADANL